MMWWRKQPTEPATTPAEALDEQLSAFIDGDLSAADAAAIEARVAAEPEVRDALDGMRQIHDSLVSLGEARAPHAFTLEAPPARAGLPRMELFARLGAAVSALALAAVLVGDVVTTAETDAQSSAALDRPATMQALAPASPTERATSEGDATAEAATAAGSAATPTTATLAAPTPATLSAPAAAPALAPATAPATTDAGADEKADTEATTAAAPAAAPAPARPTDGGRATEPEPTASAAPTIEQAAAESVPAALTDPGGDALDVAQIALLVLLVLFAGAAIWQFARRPR